MTITTEMPKNVELEDLKGKECTLKEEYKNGYEVTEKGTKVSVLFQSPDRSFSHVTTVNEDLEKVIPLYVPSEILEKI